MNCTKEYLRDKIACKLKDPEFVRYTKCMIDDEMQAACDSIMGSLSDYGGFSEEKEVVLTNGTCRQSFPDSLCVLDIIYVNGQECESLAEENTDAAAATAHLDSDFPAASCAPATGGAYTPSTVTPEKHSQNTWVFGEPVPDTGTHTALIRCVPDVSKTNEIPDVICGALRSAFNHKVLASIYALDNKSTATTQLAQIQLNMYIRELNNFRNSQFSKNQEDWNLGNRITLDGGN